MKSLNEMMRDFASQLTTAVSNQNNQKDFDPGTKVLQREDGSLQEVPGDFTFSPEIRQKAVDAAVAAVSYVVGTIWPKYKPTSRRGEGSDGGTQRVKGDPFDLD